MSNGENAIADSWEEIDEDNLTNQLDKIKKEAQELQKDTKIEDDKMPLQNGNIPAIMLAMRPDDGNYSASKPAVKILRRPTQSNDCRNLNDKPKQPIKTLQQREQEYAEARLRILGSAKNPEDELDAALDKLLSTKITPEIPTLANTNNSSVICGTTKVNSTLAQQQLLLSSLTYHSPERSQRLRQPAVIASNRGIFLTGSSNIFNQNVTEYDGGAGEPNNLNNHFVTQENVLRMPRGPDYTGGFHLRR